MSRTVVLGAHGMLGYAVRSYFAEKKDDVVALGRADFDIATDPMGKLERQLTGAARVINCAGVIKPRIAEMSVEDVLKVNAIFPRNLATLCDRLDIPMYHVTTDCVYSGDDGGYTEKSYFDAEDVYGLSKNAGDAADCMVLRTSIIGEEKGQRRSLLEWARSQAGKQVNGFLNHRWNGVTTVHLAEVIERIETQGLYAPGIHHIHSPDVVDKSELLGILNDVYGLDLTIQPVDGPSACDRSMSSVLPLSARVADKTIREQVEEMKAFFAGLGVIKYVFIQDDPFYLPKVLDKVLREFADSTAGVNIQGVNQGKRSVFQTALDLYRVYGFGYFQWKLRRYAWLKVRAKLAGMFGATGQPYSVRSVAGKYGVPVTESVNVNDEAFLSHLREHKVDLIVSISGTQLYRKKLRAQTAAGVINCHGALLPKYRGLMPSFWTLANAETVGGVSVHFVDRKLDSGPIVVQKGYRIHPHDTLEGIMARSKDLAAECIIEAVQRIEAGNPELLANDESEATSYSMPTPEDGKAFRASGRRFR